MGKRKRIFTNVGNTFWRSTFGGEDRQFDSSRLVQEAAKMTLEDLECRSPEVNSLSQFGLDGSEELLFFCTNTPDSLACGEALVSLYRQGEYQVSLETLEHFQDSGSSDSFRKGVAEYVSKMISYLDKPDSRYGLDTFINVTSGFRSLVPYATILGTVFHASVFYLYERQSKVHVLPPLPISFDDGVFQQNDLFFFRLSNDMLPRKEVQDVIGYQKMMEMMPDYLVEEDGLVYFSELGRILWGKFNAENPVLFLSDEAKKRLKKTPELKELVVKALKGEGQPEHSLHEYKGKLQCYKFDRKSVRFFYETRNGYLYIAKILDHDEYERYISQAKPNEEFRWNRERIPMEG